MKRSKSNGSTPASIPDTAAIATQLAASANRDGFIPVTLTLEIDPATLILAARFAVTKRQGLADVISDSLRESCGLVDFVADTGAAAAE